MKDEEKEIVMVENENGEYIPESEMCEEKPVVEKSKHKTHIKRPTNYVYYTKIKQNNQKVNLEEQFIEGFETGLRIVKRVNAYLKELK